MKPYLVKQKRKLNLPFAESAIVESMTPYSAHADDLAQLSTNEMAPDKIDSISSQRDMHLYQRED